MRYTKPVASAAFILAALAFGTGSVSAGQADNLRCVRAGKEVRTALDANKTSSNYDAAMAKRSEGIRACNSGFYKMGLERYSEALKLLGADKKS